MPALPAAPGVLKVTVPMTLEGDPSALSRFFVHYSGTAPTAAQLATFCDAVSAAFGTNLKALANANITQEPIEAEDLSSSTGAVGVGTQAVLCTRTGAPVAPGSAVMIQYLIARRYRGGKPKGFWPFGTSTDLTSGGTWGNTFVNTVNTDWAAFIAAVVAAGWAGAGTLTHVNVSYYQGFTVVTNPLTHRARNVPTLRGAPVIDTVVGYIIEPGVASQRRRNVI